jgi:hypothetical protein
MAKRRPPPVIEPTVLETEAGISESNPFGDLQSYGVAPLSLDGWAGLQNAVNLTLRDRLDQSAAHRARAWAVLARG